MSSSAKESVAQRLADLRPAIVARVADQLAAALPMVGVPAGASSPAASHHVQMYATAQRFHDLVLLTVTAGPSLTQFEYDWTARVLGPKGVTWSHQLQLIEAYFDTAAALAPWGDEERGALAQIAEHLRAVGERVYLG